MKRFICILMVLALWLPVTAAEKNVETDIKSEAFVKSENFLNGLSLLVQKKNPEEKITRAEFASYALAVSGKKTVEPQEASDKYLGYTNDDEEKEWEWIDDNAEVTYPQATYFYDVTTEHKYWNDINEAAKLGLMSGDGGRYFRPDEDITENEALKVLVCMLGGEFMANGSWPLGYITAAQNLSLLKNIKTETALTYKNMVIYFYNLMHAYIYESYEIEKENVSYRRSKNTYMYETFGIEKAEGIVNANGITRIGGGSGSNGATEIDGVKYFGDADSFIGMNVVAYYTEDSGDRIIKYMYADKNEILKVEAEDIKNYSSGRLYFDKNGKTDDLYLGAKTNIIYNGKALTNYNDSFLTPEDGTVTFINADSDSEYETVYIEDIKTIVTGSVDTLAQKIYNKLKTPEVYELEGKKLVIKSSDGMEMKLSDIGEDSVLSIKTTVAQQGEKNIEITVSNRIVRGKILSVAEDEITIGDNVYSISAAAQREQFKVANEGSFYLDANDKVVWYKADSDLKYGYLMNAASKKGMSDEWEMKVYGTDGEFKILQIADKVKLNGIRYDASKAMEESVINNGVEIIAQMIKYGLDENGKVSEILTADADKDKFVTLYSGEELDAVFRNGGNYKSFNVETPVCYADDETVIMNVPITDKLDENSYYNIAQEHDKYYKIRLIYADSEDSAIGKVVVMLSDVVSSASPEGKAGFVKSIVKSYVDDETVYDVTLLGENGERRLFVNDEKLLSEAETIKNGDIVRFNVDQRGYAKYIGKVFDAEKTAIADSAIRYSGYATKNPLSTGKHYVSNFHLLHGKVMSTKDGGDYLALSPFEYQKQADGSYVVQDNVEETQFMLKRNICKIYTYDSARKKLLMSNQDIITAEVAGLSEATEAVVCSFWGTAYMIVLYK